ncbi:MAG: PDZ domain-containing protein [Pirellulaceae bacterium]
MTRTCLARHCLASAALGLTALLSQSATAQQDVRQQDVRSLEAEAIRAAVDKVAPSVVRIETLGGLEKVGQVLIGTGPTTGLVVSPDGYVLSSAFNFVQKPSSILVTLPSGKRAPAEIVARDNSRMLVLLKVNTEEKLSAPESVARDDMIVGQWAVALGRTFDAPRPNMSAGVVSATNRIWGKAIQTDAKISPANYGGPLIDIEGRVLGVLVPMSPQAQNEIAGAEWYDSGIGFAVPLAEIEPYLEKMKKGEDLHAGLMGVSLKAGNQFADPALVAAVPAKSPAAKAGILAGDEIVEVDGRKIQRQTQLKHALGGRYAGDVVTVVVKRGDERVTAKIELAEKIDPYEHPFLGVLPMRDAEGVVVRYVYPDSPAEKAGVKVGDRITKLDGQEVADALALRDAVAALEIEAKAALEIDRDGKTEKLEAVLSRLPTEFPGETPPAVSAKPAGDAPAGVGVVEVVIPEIANKCFAYVPESYRPETPHGLVVWLHEPGGFDKDALVERWKTLCEENSLILLAPQAADPDKWAPTEVDFIQKTIDDVLARYNVDRTRVVAHGYKAGGAMAYLVAFQHRDLVRAVAAVDAPVPGRAPIPSNDPVERLAIYSAAPPVSPLSAAILAGLKRLSDMKYPVTTLTLGGSSYLDAEQLADLVRWIDALDRI